MGAVLACGACQSDGAAPEEDTISKDAFVQAYVALRTVGLRAPNQLLPDEDRTRILLDEGVTEEELFAFAEIHGRDVVYMRDVWNEIEERLAALRVEADSGVDRSS